MNYRSKNMYAAVLLASAFCCMASFAERAFDVPPEGFALSDWHRSHMPPSLEKRRELVDVVKRGELRLTPTFVSCGVAWGVDPDRTDVAFEYRIADGNEWMKAPKPLFFRETSDVRGSLLYLEEDTAYELRVLDGARVVASGRFRTWKTDVPVAKTVVLDPDTVRYPIRISGKGTADGWVRYTVPAGKVLGGSGVTNRIVVVERAEYVIIDGVTFVGGGGFVNEPLRIGESRAVRIVNCEFRGWGRLGPQDFFEYPRTFGGGKYRIAAKRNPNRFRYINYDAAIYLGKGAAETVIERCYMHDPRGRANSWRYSHPAGPCGILVSSPDHSTVIRYCDIVGSDTHWFNDGVEGTGNFFADGGFNRDADVYGNFMIYCNDDSIELDGGQQNVRCFGNRFESALNGVSIQGCCASPVYVMDNLFSGMGEEFGIKGSALKTATFDPWWYAPYAAVWRNIYQSVGDVCRKRGATSRWDIRDNVKDPDPSQETLSRFPVRPAGFILDTGRIDGVTVTGDKAVPQEVAVMARSTSSSPIRFRICKGSDAGWFAVSPSAGEIPAGGEMRFNVSFDAAVMKGRRDWRSAFTVRTPEGFSRCVSVVAERKDFEMPVELIPPSGTTSYAKPEKTDGDIVFPFEIEKPGHYWFFVRAHSSTTGAHKPKVSVDGSEFRVSAMYLYKDRPMWTLLNMSESTGWGGETRHFDLPAGKHTLRLRIPKGRVFSISDAVLTDSPEIFAAGSVP